MAPSRIEEEVVVVVAGVVVVRAAIIGGGIDLDGGVEDRAGVFFSQISP